MYRHDFEAAGPVSFGPALVAAALAAFAGEHFTAGPSLALLVPGWLPGRLFIAYFVGAAHLAAAVSFVMKRYVRYSAPALAMMFGLFVLLMDLPGALRHPEVRIAWSLAARQVTFSLGALGLYVTASRDASSERARTIALVVRLWTAFVLVFYGIEHFIRPELSPGVPDSTPMAAWVPLPVEVSCASGFLLVACGLSMCLEKRAGRAAALAGWLMVALTAALYVPQFFIAHTVNDRVTAINFVFDTLLFGGMMLIDSRAVALTVPASTG